MKSIVIFGAGDLGSILYSRIKDHHNVLFFVDNNYAKFSNRNSPPVLAPSVLTEREFDLVCIACTTGLEDIYRQLTGELGISPLKISRIFGEYWQSLSITPAVYGNPARIKFLEAFGLYALYHDIEGEVAECGVFRGDFAKEISRVFPDRKLYLYDTFSGFDEADLNTEEESNPIYSLMPKWLERENYFRDTGVELVRDKLSNSKQLVIKKGFFPDTFEEGNERFAFVNLDLDLICAHQGWA